METTEGKPAAPAPKTFLQTLQDHHYGYTADEATKALQECIAESERTGKATEISVTLKIKPVSKAQGRYDVLADVKNKLPPKEREAAIMFVGPDGNLTNKDPRQMEITGLRVVDKDTGEILRAGDDDKQPAVRVG